MRDENFFFLYERWENFSSPINIHFLNILKDVSDINDDFELPDELEWFLGLQDRKREKKKMEFSFTEYMYNKYSSYRTQDI